MQRRQRPQTATNVLDPTLPIDLGEGSQRQRIIDAMIECCAEKTYAATTIADIVKQASISRTTFYKRFPNKRACFDAALDYCIAEIEEAATAAHAPTDSPPEAVRKALAAMLDLMAAKPAMAQLVMSDAITVEPAILERYRSLLIPSLEGLLAESGEPRQPDAADPNLAFGRAQIMIFNQIASGRTEELSQLLPEIVYIALLPYAGHDEATQQAQLASEDLSTR
ncbi:MAG TPA: TetR/AcrR family transcriptional regulator [Solirubrobacterales bacterium]|nr:TetR/AcrR family transcriptional regulator [Solirubrobacterales bacterium]